MTRSRHLGIWPWPLLATLALLWPATARSQDLIPGAFTPAPVGLNIVTFTTTVNDGDVTFDPSLPLQDVRATITTASIAYNRTLNIGGRFASVGLGLPYLYGQMSGTLAGTFEERTRSGQGDIAGRIAIDLYGTPAMTRQQFAANRRRTNIGLSLAVVAPIGQYVSSQYINIGTNRWTFRPEVGIRRTTGAWTVEGNVAGAFYTSNADYVGGTRDQAPILALQGHLIYSFRPQLWLAGDANYWRGGRVTTNGVAALIEPRNSRLGITLVLPVSRQQLRVAYSFGARTTIGGDFHSVGVSYSYAWAARP